MAAENVLITGVSSGIGLGLAKTYLEQGSNVYGVSRRTPSELIDVTSMHFRQLDLGDFEQIAGGLEELLDGVSQLELVILNAGILGELADMSDTAIDELRRLMDINVWANKVVLDCLLKMSLRIRQVITISSGAAVNGNRGWSGYSISKAALNMLTRLYATENEQIHFTAIAPGLVDTAMQDYLCGHPQDSRFPSLDVIKSKRHTVDMPGPLDAAQNLARIIPQLPEHVESGEFVDVRQLPLGIV